MMASICADFPIYSQTFVHQELASLAGAGYGVRVAYSINNGRAGLGGRFDDLWHRRRRLRLDAALHRRDLARYRRRMPDRVDGIVERIATATGWSQQAVLEHPNVLQAFSFTRMVENYRPQYLHSYFFYDRSMMSMMRFLLQIPRGSRVTRVVSRSLDDSPVEAGPAPARTVRRGCRHVCAHS